MIPLLTLGAIREHRPCQDGWAKLLRNLGHPQDMATLVSLGDVAKSNGVSDALWCIRVLDWQDVAIRRAVVAGCLLPTVKRAAADTSDQRARDCIAVIEAWCGGQDLDLQVFSWRDVLDTEWGSGWDVEWAATVAAWRAARAAKITDATRAAPEAAVSAGYAARTGAERRRQEADIIAAAPMHALRETRRD